MSVEDKPLSFGNLVLLIANGEFEMTGIKIPLEVRVEIEPQLDEKNKPQLGISASFKLPLKTKVQHRRARRSVTSKRQS